MRRFIAAFSYSAAALLSVVCALLLGSCGLRGESAASPTPTQRAPSFGFLSSLAVDTILLQYDYESTFWNVEANRSFAHVPPLTVFADGTAFYVDSGNPSSANNQQLMIAHLTAEETRTLLQHVLVLGFERLESHLEHCNGPPEGVHTCVADGSYSIIRVRLAPDTIREVRNYADFANDAQALADLRTFLSTYRHPTAQPYQAAHVTLFVRRGTMYDNPPLSTWPIPSTWVAPAQQSTNGQWPMVIAGAQYDQLLTQLPRNMGEYVVRVDGSLYTLQLIPWLPYQDYTTDIQAYQRLVTPSIP